MLARLLESQEETDRSLWGAAVSTLVHTAAIGAAVFATAQARVEPPAPPPTIRWVSPAVPPAPAARSAAPAQPRKVVPIPRALDVPDRIEVFTTPVEPDLGVPGPSPLTPGNAGETSSSSSSAAGAVVDPSQPFSAESVERQAYLAEGAVTPRYPRSLRAAGIEGQVTAMFVVSEAGRVERGTLRFTRSDNPLFEAAVRDALERMRFIPAEVGGKKVRQLVQMPFVFRLGG